MSDGLEARHRRAIIAAIAANPRIERAVLFGSRARGTHTVASDVDIALFGCELSAGDLARLMEELGESTIPQRVDVVLCGAIGNAVLAGHIVGEGIEWYARRASGGVGACGSVGAGEKSGGV